MRFRAFFLIITAASQLITPVAEARTFFECFLGAIRGTAAAPDTPQDRIIAAENKIAKLKQKLQDASRKSQTFVKVRGGLVPETDVLKDDITNAEYELTLAREHYLAAVISPEAMNAHQADTQVFAAHRGAVFTFENAHGLKKTTGQLVKISNGTIELLAENNGVFTRELLPVKDLKIDATRLDARAIAGDLDSKLAKFKEQQDKASQLASNNRAAQAAAQTALNERSNPVFRREYRDGKGDVAVFSLPQNDPADYLVKLHEWTANVGKLLPGRISNQFLKQLDSSKIEFHLSAVTPEARAYVDNALRKLSQPGQTPEKNFSNALNEVRTAELKIKEDAPKSVWPEFLRDEQYLRIGEHFDSVDKDTSTVHPDVALNRLPTYSGRDGDRTFSARVLHLRNGADGEIYGKEAIVVFTDPDGKKTTEFYAIGTHINDPRGKGQACLGCHTLPGGGLNPAIANSFNHEQGKQLTSFQQLKPWLR